VPARAQQLLVTLKVRGAQRLQALRRLALRLLDELARDALVRGRHLAHARLRLVAHLHAAQLRGGRGGAGRRAEGCDR
jgi:hypothetical protein